MYIPYFPIKPDGVPVLSAKQIDIIAEQLVRDVQPELFTTQIDATNLSLVMKQLKGWHFAGRYLSENGGLLGLSCFQGGKLMITDETRTEKEVLHVPPHSILIDRALFKKANEKLFRFVLGHEMGHALFHEEFASKKENMKAYKEQAEQRLLEDSAARLGIREKRKLSNAHDWVEWQANAFSSSLLMPRSLVFQTRNLVFEDRIPYMECLNELCITMMDVFKVSQTAAFYRLKELEIAPDACHMMPSGIIVRNFIHPNIEWQQIKNDYGE